MLISEFDKTTLTNKLEEILATFADFLGIDMEYDYSVMEYERVGGETREYVALQLRTQNEALLIGHHGQTLERIQNLIGLGLAQEFKQVVRVVVNINDYRDRHETNLRNLAGRARMQVIESGQDMELAPMNASDRRIVHQALQEEGGVGTESTGDGKDRRIVVKAIK